MPEAVLNGYFAYMALESLPGNQLWERFLLLFSDPHRRRWCAAPALIPPFCMSMRSCQYT